MIPGLPEAAQVRRPWLEQVVDNLVSMFRGQCYISGTDKFYDYIRADANIYCAPETIYGTRELLRSIPWVDEEDLKQEALCYLYSLFNVEFLRTQVIFQYLLWHLSHYLFAGRGVGRNQESWETLLEQGWDIWGSEPDEFLLPQGILTVPPGTQFHRYMLYLLEAISLGRNRASEQMLESARQVNRYMLKMYSELKEELDAQAA
jgi:hypothetical protein